MRSPSLTFLTIFGSLLILPEMWPSLRSMSVIQKCSVPFASLIRTLIKKSDSPRVGCSNTCQNCGSELRAFPIAAFISGSLSLTLIVLSQFDGSASRLHANVKKIAPTNNNQTALAVFIGLPLQWLLQSYAPNPLF